MKLLKPVNVPRWLDEHRDSFQPPICNKMMYNDQLKVFFVGGPNQRADYHIEEGEEFFYQLKGDMCLNVVERGVHKTIDIKEGEAFLLPARIPHSPQRKANTMGLVIERARAPCELDGLRYYVPGTKQVLYERWFHCTDLGTQLAPIIKQFFASDECRTGLPSANTRLHPVPFADDITTRLPAPISLSAWLKCYEEEIEVFGRKELWATEGLSGGGDDVDDGAATFESRVHIFGGNATHYIDASEGETFLWQMTQHSRLSIGSQRVTLATGTCLLVPPGCKMHLHTESGHTLALCMSSLAD